MSEAPGQERAARTGAGWTTKLTGRSPRGDLVAGLTVGAVLVPQSLAYGELAAMPAVTGLYVALAATTAYAIVGSAAHSSLGPTATSAILAAAAGSSLAGPDDYPLALAGLAVVAGLLALAAGAIRLGFLANLLSRTVLTGYTAGAAAVIVVTQLGALLGVRLGSQGPAQQPRVVEVLADLPGSLEAASVTTLAVAVASVAGLVVVDRLLPRLPAALTVLVGAIAASRIFDLAGHGVAVVGEIPAGLPDVAWPDLSVVDAGSLVGAAAALTMVGFAETLAQGRAFAGRPTREPRRSDKPDEPREPREPADPGGPHTPPRPQPDTAADGFDNPRQPAEAAEPDPNRELMALGAANLASGLCGGFPASASFSRGAVNVRAGGRTRRAGVVAAVVVALCLVALTGILEQLPQATLAAIVITAVVPLVPIRTFRRLAGLQRDDFVFAVSAAVGTIVLGILPGLAIAVALSIGGLLYRVTAADTAVLGYVPEQDAWRSLDRFANARTSPGIVVLRFTGPLYFANAARLRHEVTQVVAERAQLHRLVIDGRAISHLDVTALDMLADLHGRLARDGVTLVVAGVRGAALDTLIRSDLARTVGAEQLIFPTVRAATGA